MLSALEWVLCNDVTFTVLLLGDLFLLSVFVSAMGTVMNRERFARGVVALSEKNPLAFITPDVEKFRHSFQLRLPR